MHSWIDELPIRPVTKRLVQYYLLDLPMPAFVAVDFGIDSLTHYQALKAVLFDDQADATQTPEQVTTEVKRRIVEIDAALGNGPMLNALVRKYAPHYAEGVHFETGWDLLWGRSDKYGF